MPHARPMTAVTAAYDQWARTYDTVANATRDLAATVLRQYPLALRSRAVLETGCGTGLNTPYLALQSRSVLAVDGSASMLAQARARITAPHVQLVQGDLQQPWPVATASVDDVVCLLMLEHFPELSLFFQEAVRVLRPGGECFVCELHPFRQLQGRQARFTEAQSGQVVLIPAYLHDVSEYVQASMQQGFALLRLEEWREAHDTARTLPPRLLSLHLRKP